MTGKTIAVRVDASVQMGTGHVMRCLALAAQLRDEGAAVTFISRRQPGDLCDFVRARGYAVHVLADAPREADASARPLPHAAWLGVPQQQDARQTAEVLKALGGIDWLIVDHYALDAEWEGVQRAYAKYILAIDDVADRAHDCDILLDQNLHDDAEARYANRLPAGAVRLFGPRYALLRDEFAAARRTLRPRDGVVKRLLVSFGGIDADNLTGRVLDILAKLDVRVTADVIVGANSPHRDELHHRYAGLEGIVLHDQISDMARLMQGADLAIGASGGTTWERCALGLPSIVVPLADNQIPTLRALADTGAAFVASDEVLPADRAARAMAPVLDYALRAPGALRLQSRQALAVTDGKGAKRVARQMCLPDIACRKATAADAAAIHAWRNSPDIRRSSRQPDEIDLATHIAWFERMLADPNVDLLICELAGEPVGVLRYDRKADGAVVSIYLVPARLGGGWGNVVLAAGESWLRASRPGVKVLHAEARADNAPSHAMFGSAGYTPAFAQFEKRIVA